MGGVQAKAAKPKPERGRAGLERKTSFAKNHRVVPINAEPRPTDDLCKDFEDDKNLQDLVAALGSSAKEVICSTGLDQLKQCLKCLTDYDEKMKEAILSCRTQILEAEGVQARVVMTRNENLLDDLIGEYLKNSAQTLNLCRSELQEFIDSASRAHLCITDVLERGVSKKLNESERKYHGSAEAVRAKVKSLIDQHRNTLDKSNDRIQKLDKELELNRTLKKVVNVVFLGMLFGLFVCTIMAAAMAAPPVASALTSTPCIYYVVAAGAVGYGFSSVLKEGQRRLLTSIQGNESSLEAHKGVIKSMEAGTGLAIKELDDIMCHVNNVIAKGNGPVLSNLSSANDEGRVHEKEIIEKKLTEFHKAIEELDKKKEQCLEVIEMGRNKVQREYQELKKGPVLNTKIKK